MKLDKPPYYPTPTPPTTDPNRNHDPPENPPPPYTPIPTPTPTPTPIPTPTPTPSALPSQQLLDFQTPVAEHAMLLAAQDERIAVLERQNSRFIEQMREMDDLLEILHRHDAHAHADAEIRTTMYESLEVRLGKVEDWYAEIRDANSVLLRWVICLVILAVWAVYRVKSSSGREV